MIIVFHHAVGVEAVTRFALPLGRQASPHVHAGGVEPDEKRLVGFDCLVHEAHCGVGKFLVDDLHALAGQRAGILDLAIGVGVNHPARREALAKLGILGIEIGLGLLLRVEVVQVAEELVKAVVGRQEFVLVAQVVLAELRGGVAQWLEQLGDGGVLGLQADIGAGQADLQQAGAQRVLAGDKGRAPGGAALLAVIIGEQRALPGDAIDIGCAAPQHAAVIGADVGPADIVAPDHQDIRLVGFRLCGQWRQAEQRQCDCPQQCTVFH